MGRFDLPARNTLPDRGRLLVSSNATDVDRATNRPRPFRQDARAVLPARQRGGHARKGGRVVSGPLRYRAACARIGRVSQMRAAAFGRQSRKASMVPKTSAGLRRCAAVDAIEQPGDLGGGK